MDSNYAVHDNVRTSQDLNQLVMLAMPLMSHHILMVLITLPDILTQIRILTILSILMAMENVKTSSQLLIQQLSGLSI